MPSTMPSSHAPTTRPASAKTHFQGLVDWRHLNDWLLEDGLILREEHERTVACCAQAESSQHAVVRLAALGLSRARDGKALDVEELTQFLAEKAGVQYLRIDPLRVDVGKVAEAMSASFSA